MALEFSSATAELSGVLSMMAQVIPSRPVKSAYNGVLAVADGNRIIFTATDGEMSIRAGLDADVLQGGQALFPAKLLTELVRRQTGDTVRVKVDERGTAKVTSAGSKSSVVCMAAEDFPEIHEVTGHEVHIPSGKLKNAVGRVMFAVSDDESRKVLTGIRLEAGSSETRLVSVDGFKLALRVIEAENAVPSGKECVGATIPGYALARVAKFLPDDESDVVVTVGQTHCSVRFGGVMVYATLLTGEYLAYGNLISQQSATEIEIDRDALFFAIDRCGLIAREGRNNLITMVVDRDNVTMRSRAETGDVTEEIPVVTSGDCTTISFNSQYLSETVKAAETDKIRLYMSGPTSPCLVRPAEGNAFTYLVLPVRTYE